jgi:hypothetical protein
MDPKTAVDWFYCAISHLNFKSIDMIRILEWYNKAKELEKKQIIHAHGTREHGGFDSSGNFFIRKITGEEYYNEKYEK